VLNGTNKRGRKTDTDRRRTISGDTLVGQQTGSNTTLQEAEELVHGDSKTLDLDWTVDVASPAKNHGIKAATSKATSKSARRRSTRLQLVNKAKVELVERTRTRLGVLGKRTRSAFESAKDNAVKGLKDKAAAGSNDGQPEKKKVKVEESSELEKRNPKKKWLTNGLYVGLQRGEDSKLTHAKNKGRQKKQDNEWTQTQSFLPLPMFTGERVINWGRAFKLPYDVFSPLPPGQPKPEEWRKTQKSK
jgi:histone-lysine N-methyltransferase ASH1L